MLKRLFCALLIEAFIMGGVCGSVADLFIFIEASKSCAAVGEKNVLYVEVVNRTDHIIENIDIDIFLPRGLSTPQGTLSYAPGQPGVAAGRWHLLSLRKNTSETLEIELDHSEGFQGRVLEVVASVVGGLSDSTSVQIACPFWRWSVDDLQGDNKIQQYLYDGYNEYIYDHLPFSIGVQTVGSGGISLETNSTARLGDMLKISHSGGKEQYDISGGNWFDPFDPSNPQNTFTPSFYSDMTFSFDSILYPDGIDGFTFSLLALNERSWRDGVIVWGENSDGEYVYPQVRRATQTFVEEFSQFPAVHYAQELAGNDWGIVYGELKDDDPRTRVAYHFSENISSFSIRYYNQAPSEKSATKIYLSDLYSGCASEVVMEYENIPPVAGVGESVALRVRITNTGQSDVVGINVSEVIPYYLRYIDGVASHGEYSASQRSWSIDVLGSGQSATLDLQMRIGLKPHERKILPPALTFAGAGSVVAPKVFPLYVKSARRRIGKSSLKNGATGSCFVKKKHRNKKNGKCIRDIAWLDQGSLGRYAMTCATRDDGGSIIDLLRVDSQGVSDYVTLLGDRECRSVDWLSHEGGPIVAIGGAKASGEPVISIYYFDRAEKKLYRREGVQDFGLSAVSCVKWLRSDYDDIFLVVGRDSSASEGDPSLEVYSMAVDGENYNFELVGSFRDVDHVRSVDCLDINSGLAYVMVGGDSSSGVHSKMYKFDKGQRGLSRVVTNHHDHGARVRSVLSVQDDKESYLVAMAGDTISDGGQDVGLRLYRFDLVDQSLTEVESARYDHGGDIYSIDVIDTNDAKYFIIGGGQSLRDSASIRVLEYTDQSQSLSPVDGGDMAHGAGVEVVSLMLGESASLFALGGDVGLEQGDASEDEVNLRILDINYEVEPYDDGIDKGIKSSAPRAQTIETLQLADSLKKLFEQGAQDYVVQAVSVDDAHNVVTTAGIVLDASYDSIFATWSQMKSDRENCIDKLVGDIGNLESGIVSAQQLIESLTAQIATLEQAQIDCAQNVIDLQNEYDSLSTMRTNQEREFIEGLGALDLAYQLTSLERAKFIEKYERLLVEVTAHLAEEAFELDTFSENLANDPAYECPESPGS
jgi:hypothetical protein